MVAAGGAAMNSNTSPVRIYAGQIVRAIAATGLSEGRAVRAVLETGLERLECEPHRRLPDPNGASTAWNPGSSPPQHERFVAAIGDSGRRRYLITAQYMDGEWLQHCPTPIRIDPPQWWADLP